MSKKNFTITTVATAPSPATSGTSLVVATGTGSLFALNEPAIVFPTNSQPLTSNAEIVKVSNVVGDTLTIVRGQEGTTARSIVTGDIIIQGITAKDWNDLVASKFTWRGAWATTTAYAVNDTVEYGGSGYVCIVAHTSGTFATDLTNGKWEMFVEGVSADSIASTIHGATAKTTPVDADEVGLIDSAASNVLKKLTWSNIKATLKTYFDSVTTTLTNKTLTSPVINTGVSGTAILDEDNMASNSATKLATQQSIKAYADTKITKAPNITSIDDTGIADGEVAIFDLTNKKIKTSDKTLPTGAIVGTTDTQTLTNKTIDGNNNTLKHIIPAGSITMYGGSTAPTGYLLCDGSAVSRTTYADLFTAIGTTYGAGDGSTTFNIPNIKGRVVVGYNSADTSFDALGETGGEKKHTLSVAEMPKHKHTDKIRVSPTGFGDSAVAVANASGTLDETGYFIGNTGGGEAHNNLQPYIVLNYIIKT